MFVETNFISSMTPDMYSNLRIVILTLWISIFSSSCANYKINLAEGEEKWEEKSPDPNQKIKHTVYMTGDAGRIVPEEANPVLELLKKKLSSADKNTTMIFLGNQLYPNGMPPKNAGEERKIAEAQLNAQLSILDDFKGCPLFIPGHRDWLKYGLKGVKRQEKYIEEYLDKNKNKDNDDEEDYFLPDEGCGDFEAIDLNDQLGIIAVDSEWYLHDWDKEPEINDGCEIKSLKVFDFNFQDQIRKYRNKNAIVVMHHPPYSNGTYGGKYPAKEHIFPLTTVNPNLYLPLPIVGSAAMFLRSVFGGKQELSNGNYAIMKESIVGSANKNGSYIFASAHDRSLQYFNQKKQHFIVSGGGSSRTPAGKGNEVSFSYGAMGFSQLDFYEDGTTWLTFWTPDGEHGRVVFKKKIKGPLEISEDNIPNNFPEYEAGITSKTLKPLKYEVTNKNGFHDMFFGEHYRELYTHQYEFPVLHLDTFKGGVKVMKRGGGNQTSSLRLEATNGQQYAMRALTKDVSRLLPYPFNRLSAAEYIAEDNFLSTHPFAPLSIPILADAAKVYHTNPKLYYIPKQPVLGVHNDVYGDEVYLVEERPDDDWSNEPSFGNSKKIVSTSDTVEELIKNHNNKIDQPWALRSRLFDLIIGDWDRHDDQWRFAKIEKGDIDYYRPIPRDRDQVFSKYDGMVAGIARLTVPFMRQFNPYSGEIKNMKWHSWSSRYYDHSFINELSWEDWKKEAEYLKENITNEIIEEAFEMWPQQAKDLTAEEIKTALRKRRDSIVAFARAFYLLNAEKVDIVGTNDEDGFEVEHLDTERTRVRMYDLETKDDKRKLVYERTFNASETKELVLYGSSEEDVFEIKGDKNSGILIRIVGGIDEDIVVDETKRSGKKVRYYDMPNDYKITNKGGIKERATNRRDYNIYDRKAWHYEYNYMIPVPVLGYNPDNGFLLGANLLWTTYNFKKSPYAATHQIIGNYAFATQSPEISYQGDFLNTFGDWDLLVDANFRGDKFTLNFFGLGNETQMQPESKDFDFNRVRQSSLNLGASFKYRFSGEDGVFKIGPVVEFNEIEFTEGRFLSSEFENENAPIFDQRIFGGIKGGLSYQNLDHPRLAARGLRLSASYAYRNDFNSSEELNSASAKVTVYLPITKDKRFLFATRAGIAQTWGNAPFFYLPNLGGASTLRGYRFNRFYGNTAVYHNTDIRFELFKSSNNILPFTFGLHGGFDYGRVWLDDEDSDKWHSNYGGGIWLAPVDFIILSGGLYISEEDKRVIVQIGHSF